MTTLSLASRHFDGVSGAAIGAICVAIAAVLACMPPYRTQKIFMLLFSLLVVVGGMYKFRHALANQAGAQRYFYAASVFSLWFICCVSVRPHLRSLLAAVVLFAELLELPIIKDRPRITADLEWPVWASYISSGLPLAIPTSPEGWYLRLPASSRGPLAPFAAWVGQNISDVSFVDPSACKGAASLTREVGRAGEITFARSMRDWITTGSASDTNGTPVELVAITNETERVVGFGFTGFTTKDADPPRSGWNAIYRSPSGNVQAFGIVDDGRRICPLSVVPSDTR